MNEFNPDRVPSTGRDQQTAYATPAAAPGSSSVNSSGGNTSNGGSSARQADGSTVPGQTTTQAPNTRTQGDQPATVLVRGETVRDGNAQQGNDAHANGAAKGDKDKAPPKVAPEKAAVAERLPALADDDDVGVQKEQVVTRDGKADLAFTGTLVATAASECAIDGKWQELRVYETSAGKHVFSRINRTVYVGKQDSHEADIFDPAPDSKAQQLLRSARDLTHSKPLEWTDSAVDFFGYSPLAKALYRKLSGRFEEHIS